MRRALATEEFVTRSKYPKLYEAEPPADWVGGEFKLP